MVRKALKLQVYIEMPKNIQKALKNQLENFPVGQTLYLWRILILN